mgnify:FL=1
MTKNMKNISISGIVILIVFSSELLLNAGQSDIPEPEMLQESYLSDCGSDAFTSQALLGHASLTQTSQYTHKTISAKRSTIRGMEKYIMDMTEEGKIMDINSVCGTT